MKKILYVFCLMIFVFSLSGCESNEKERKKIFDALKHQDIISDSMRQIDVASCYSYTIFGRTSNYYIYKDKDSKMIKIHYDKITSDEIQYDHIAEVCFDITIDKSVNPLDYDSTEENYCKYENGEYTDYIKYYSDNCKKYGVKVKKFLFFDNYIIEEYNEDSF